MWWQLKSFSGWGEQASYLLPRWLLLRGVGLVYICIFFGILQEGSALIGPSGLSPIERISEVAQEHIPNVFERILRVPSLFLVNSDPAMMATLQWSGLVAAIALLLNLWPRMALFVCWAILLSFVATWEVFSSTQNDKLMLETALLCIPFAPSGFRPGLGVASPPRPITVFMVRWLLIRIILVAGWAKISGSDPRWLDFTMMEDMYETSPSPTILGYYAFHLPRSFHVFEILFTFAVELVAPFLAIFGGRRGRAIAFAMWTAFQLGIQLTGNFGWLNTSAIALGLLLLDDQMIASFFRRIRAVKFGERLVAISQPASIATGRRFVALGVLLWLHFGLTIHFSITTLRGEAALGLPDPRVKPIEYLFREFRSSNCYPLYASTSPIHEEVEFAGSNDRGVTWRPYPFRSKPQDEDRMSPFLAPRFHRFEATLQIVLENRMQVSLIRDVARELVQGNPEVIGLFADNPFPDKPPQAVRMIVYRYTFTDRKTQGETGRYWNKEYLGEYARPAVANQPIR